MQLFQKCKEGRSTERKYALAGLLLLFSLSSCASVPTRPAEYDMAIMNGRVMNPETGLDGVLNVGISKGRIAIITNRTIRATRVIDADGLVVAPGFIDMHAHDHNETTHRLHAQDGVTTALELEFGTYPVKRWYERRIGKSAINFGASVSHGMIRAVAMGAVDPEELTGETEEDHTLAARNFEWTKYLTSIEQRKAMAALIKGELRNGGVGIGYHLANTPGADKEEMLFFYRLSAAEKTMNFVHYRSFEQVSPKEGALELVEAAKATGASIHAVHVNSSALDDVRSVLAHFDQARADGLDITTEVYPYTGAESSLADPRLGSLAALGKTYADLELVETGERLTAGSFAYHKARSPNGALIVHIMRQADIDYAVAHAGTIIASDGSVYVEGRGHPRSAGTFSRIFARYVRELKTLSLMDAIARVSYLPARRLEAFAPAMKERGRLRVGAAADITIFDAKTITDQATYANSGIPSSGILYVLVNGVPVVDAGTFVAEAKPGKPIFGKDKRH